MPCLPHRTDATTRLCVRSQPGGEGGPRRGAAREGTARAQRQPRARRGRTLRDAVFFLVPRKFAYELFSSLCSHAQIRTAAFAPGFISAAKPVRPTAGRRAGPRRCQLLRSLRSPPGTARPRTPRPAPPSWHSAAPRPSRRSPPAPRPPALQSRSGGAPSAPGERAAAAGVRQRAAAPPPTSPSFSSRGRSRAGGRRAGPPRGAVEAAPWEERRRPSRRRPRGGSSAGPDGRREERKEGGGAAGPERRHRGD